ncbi:hypothetical protein ACH3XX_00755 [Streptomyces scabiei]|uniref:hypothetical protein n=1 Tax=Streptomyces scabiei TaxID=1930 RepID=UPI00378FB223
MTSYKPSVGDVVEDTDRKRVGKLMSIEGDNAWLRPLGGGREWDARPERLRPATPAQALSANVAAANARSRGESP